ncbi:hypothetical protein LTS12_028165 [Elasticomyces elasticus]|nr:hypothetical protein LTS12_028165 [Elasticomyces elasticus]
MRATLALRNAHTPLIRFLGKRSVPQIDHSPRAHPLSPSGSLPDSFASYRVKAQQHGPLGRASFTQGAVGRNAGAALGPVQPREGEYFDRDDLPQRFHRLPYSEAEIEAIETGGASLCA